MRRALFLLACLALAAAPVRAEPDSGTEVAQLERAVAAHPDDPDLLWALAGALADASRLEEGVEQLRTFRARWPDRRPDAALRLGQWLYTLGRDAQALEALEESVSRAPESGAAHLALGLLYKRLERISR